MNPAALIQKLNGEVEVCAFFFFVVAVSCVVRIVDSFDLI